jgi:hypothetical protein
MGYIQSSRVLGKRFQALKDHGFIHYEGIRNVGEEETYLPVKKRREAGLQMQIYYTHK